MKQYLILICLSTQFCAFAQIKFEEGYFINNDGEKTECLIKNVDWKNNPAEITIKASESSETEKVDVDNLQEFGIYEYSKYIKAKVEIDRSGKLMNELSEGRAPEFEEEELLLKVLIEGDATLYSYNDNNLERYFYSTKIRPIEQLIYKRYLVKHDDHTTNVMDNNDFRGQLWSYVKCEGFPESFPDHVDYFKNELVKYFKKYNECKEVKYINYNASEKRDIFDLRITPGIDNAALQFDNLRGGSTDVDFGGKYNFRIGIEADIILPFNKNKWHIIIEPTYQYFKEEKELNAQTVRSDYSSIELPFGIRHHFYILNDATIFLNAFYVVSHTIDDEIIYSRSYDIPIKQGNSLAFGAGMSYNRFSAELRYYLPRSMTHVGGWASQYKKIAFIVGVKIF